MKFVVEIEGYFYPDDKATHIANIREALQSGSPDCPEAAYTPTLIYVERRGL
jgi:hypothetical protein